MKTLLLISLFLTISCSLLAQGSTDSTHVAVIDTAYADSLANEVKATAIEALKDSIQDVLPIVDTTGIKEEVKSTAIKALTDSLNNYVEVPNIALDSTITDELESEAKSKISEELNYDIPKIDSATVKAEAKAFAKEQLEAETGIDVPDITIDSTTVDQVKKEATSRAEEALKSNEELKDLNALDDQMKEVKDIGKQVEETQQQIKEKAARKELKKKMTTHAKQYITENAESVQQLQSKMGSLKQKYSMVPNSNDLSTAKKRGSLKGESFWKRLIIGGNFNVTKTNPVTIDFSPKLGWRFSKVVEAGFTGTYRAKFGADSNSINSFENDDIYGYSIFANYMVFKNFFGYLEGERMSKVVGTNEDHARKWQNTLLAGIGRKFNVAKFLEMQAIITYNFLHDNTDGVYGSPIVFKTGFRIKK